MGVGDISAVKACVPRQAPPGTGDAFVVCANNGPDLVQLCTDYSGAHPLSGRGYAHPYIL